MAPITEGPKLPKMPNAEITVIGKGKGGGVPAPVPEAPILPRNVRPFQVAEVGGELVLKDRFSFKEGEIVEHGGKNYRVVVVGKDQKLIPVETGAEMRVDPTGRAGKAQILALGSQGQPALQKIEISPPVLEDATTQVIALNGVITAEKIFRMFGVDFSPAVSQRRSFHELQMGLRPGELENPPVTLKELARRRAQVIQLNKDARSVVGDVYEGADVKKPEKMDPGTAIEIADWAQRGKELGIPKEIVIDVAVTHIARTWEASSPTKEHKNTLRDITEAVETARQVEGKGDLTASEKRAAFLASMDPKVANYYLGATDANGKPLFSAEEQFLYQQYGVLRIFLENGGTPDPMTISQHADERVAFLSIFLPEGAARNDFANRKILVEAFKELLIVSGKSQGEAMDILRPQYQEVNFLAEHGIEEVKAAEMIEEGVIELTDQDLLAYDALEATLGPDLASDLVTTNIYSRETDVTREFVREDPTNPNLATTGNWQADKAEFLSDLRRVRSSPTLELSSSDILSQSPFNPRHTIDRDGNIYTIRSQHWMDTVTAQPGEKIARLDGKGSVKHVFKNGERMVRVQFSLEEPQALRNNQVEMVQQDTQVFWLTPQMAEQMGILSPNNHELYWVLGEGN